MFETNFCYALNLENKKKENLCVFFWRKRKNEDKKTFRLRHVSITILVLINE